MRKHRFMDLSVLTCSRCGGKFPIMRCHGQKREVGHIKDMWCPYCKANSKFIEHMEEM